MNRDDSTRNRGDNTMNGGGIAVMKGGSICERRRIYG